MELQTNKIKEWERIIKKVEDVNYRDIRDCKSYGLQLITEINKIKKEMDKVGFDFGGDLLYKIKEIKSILK